MGPQIDTVQIFVSLTPKLRLAWPSGTHLGRPTGGHQQAGDMMTKVRPAGRRANVQVSETLHIKVSRIRQESQNRETMGPLGSAFPALKGFAISTAILHIIKADDRRIQVTFER